MILQKIIQFFISKVVLKIGCDILTNPMGFIESVSETRIMRYQGGDFKYMVADRFHKIKGKQVVSHGFFERLYIKNTIAKWHKINQSELVKNRGY